MVAIAYLYTLIALTVVRYADCSVGVSGPEGSNDGAKEPPSDSTEGPHASEVPSGVGDADEKKKLAETGEKLDEAAKEAKVSQQVLDTISKEQEHMKEKIGHKNLDKVKELLAKKKELLKKIASVGKTLRVEHDALYPHLVGKPIIIIAKDEDDIKRAANTLAHLEGVRDVMNRIRSPCSSLERIRSVARETAKQDKRSRFAVIQKTLDSMSAEQRMNYDQRMIEHYEGIISEIENGIAMANEELASAWKNYTQ